MGLAMLAIKIPVTFEMIRLLYSGARKKEMRAVWIYSILVGLIASYLVVGLRQQSPLSHREMTYIRQVAQVFIAALAIAMMLHWWVHHYRRGFSALHGCLITTLWINYAVIGIIRPEDHIEWFTLADIWSAVMILALLTRLFWIRTYLGPPGIPSGGSTSSAKAPRGVLLMRSFRRLNSSVASLCKR